MAILSSAPLQFVASIPPATRAITGATVAVSLLYYFLVFTGSDVASLPWLVLIPGSSIFYPWTFLTSAFVESTIIELLFTLIVVPPSLRYLERLWGAVEIIKFVAVTITVSNVIAFGLCWLEYMVFKNPTFLYGQAYHGQMALQIGILVAFTQVIPEHQVQLFGVLKARVKTLPMAYVTFSTVMCIIGFQCPFIVIQFGWLVSYLWLRFYKKNSGEVLSGGPAYGDRSETFAFVNWFPPFIHGPITLLANTAHKLATKFHLIPSGNMDLEAGGYSQLPGGARAEAERRRPSARAVSSSQKLNGSIDLHNIDPDELFTKHTISEIKLVQSRLRAEAEAKQEELRLMVGERYRDLLEASTSILNLAKSSKHVLEALEEMRDTVNSITPARTPRRAPTGEDKHLQALQSLSAHVKLLLDAPEHLWRLMERKAYLNASWLFLLARVVHRALSQEDEEQTWHAYGIDVAEQLPLVQRQWDTITPFRSQISHKATLYLRETTSTPGEVCATLLTLHLLESRPLPETLSIYLAQRTKTLSTLLTRTASTSANGNASDTKMNVKPLHRPRKVVVKETKQRVEAVLDLIARTVGSARLIFASTSPDHPTIMQQALAFFQAPTDQPENLSPELQLSTQILLTSLPSASQLLLLPPAIRSYKPYIDGAPLASSDFHSQVQQKLDSWFKKAIYELREALVDWLTPLESVRDVWDVRRTLLQWLGNAEGLLPSEREALEAIIDGAALQQAATVWKAALVRLETSFSEAVAAAVKALTEDTDAQPLDTRPIEYLFQAPSIPLGFQAGTHSAAAAAAQFSKYKSALEHQLGGRTPMVDSALNVLESHALQLRDDLACLQKSLDSKSELIKRLSEAYRLDSESTCKNICEVLERTATHEDHPLRVSTCISRITQELAKSPGFFVHLGCDEATTQLFRERLGALVATVVREWQKQIVLRIVERHIDYRSLGTGGSSEPMRPSAGLTEALLSLSSELQHLGVHLDRDYRQRHAASTLQCFIAALCDRVERDPSAAGPQVLWDLSFLRHIVRTWGPSCQDALERIDHIVISLREDADAQDEPEVDFDSSTQAYLAKTQILLASLLPSRPAAEVGPTGKADKSSSLLLFGIPPAEHGFESALQLIKTPPRFGLLLAGGAALR
ncbi:hypothetical protein BN946_scf185007.g12 [Trametes cinnabarina]|uniref:Uncharacterized protein n=1 Tax=Pycnoporus cinnabarinus TaxID=5643 RepID=A0A060SKL0_PYCCI|nr:hypothetical protein BN946_scf185007.g12 [Trametes cinnabarina]